MFLQARVLPPARPVTPEVRPWFWLRFTFDCRVQYRNLVRASVGFLMRLLFVRITYHIFVLWYNMEYGCSMVLEKYFYSFIALVWYVSYGNIIYVCVCMYCHIMKKWFIQYIYKKMYICHTQYFEKIIYNHKYRFMSSEIKFVH